MTKEVITHFLGNNIPQFTKIDYPNFHELIQGFYRVLESDGNFLNLLNNFKQNKRLSTADDVHLNKLLFDMGFDYIGEMAIDKRQFAKYLFDFYLSAGSTQSFEFLFRALFNKSVRIEYPRESLLVPSSAQQVKNYFIYTSAKTIDSDSFKHIRDNVENLSAKINGLSSKTETAVESVEIIYTSRDHYLKFGIFPPKTPFMVNEKIQITLNEFTITENIKNILELKVLNSGILYDKNDRITITGSNILGNATIQKINSGEIESLEIVGENNLREGQILITKPIIPGAGFCAKYENNRMQIYSNGRGYLTLPEIDSHDTKILAKTDDIGGIFDLSLNSPYVDFNKDDIQINIESINGSGFKYEVQESTIFVENKRKTNIGVLGIASTLIDSYKYQQFSYLIISEVLPVKYLKLVNDYLHPSGYIYFPVYEITSEVDFNFDGSSGLEIHKVLNSINYGDFDVQFDPLEFEMELTLTFQPNQRYLYSIIDNMFEFVKFDSMFKHPISKYYDYSVNFLESKKAGQTFFSDAHEMEIEIHED